MSRHFVYCFVCNQEYPDKDGFTCQYCSERCYKMSRKKEIEALQQQHAADSLLIDKLTQENDVLRQQLSVPPEPHTVAWGHWCGVKRTRTWTCHTCHNVHPEEDTGVHYQLNGQTLTNCAKCWGVMRTAYEKITGKGESNG